MNWNIIYSCLNYEPGPSGSCRAGGSVHEQVLSASAACAPYTTGLLLDKCVQHRRGSQKDMKFSCVCPTPHILGVLCFLGLIWEPVKIQNWIAIYPHWTWNRVLAHTKYQQVIILFLMLSIFHYLVYFNSMPWRNKGKKCHIQVGHKIPAISMFDNMAESFMCLSPSWDMGYKQG